MVRPLREGASYWVLANSRESKVVNEKKKYLVYDRLIRKEVLAVQSPEVYSDPANPAPLLYCDSDVIGSVT